MDLLCFSILTIAICLDCNLHKQLTKQTSQQLLNTIALKYIAWQCRLYNVAIAKTCTFQLSDRHTPQHDNKRCK